MTLIECTMPNDCYQRFAMVVPGLSVSFSATRRLNTWHVIAKFSTTDKCLEAFDGLEDYKVKRILSRPDND